MTLNNFEIKKAECSLAEDICSLLIESIKHLCRKDHQDDSLKLQDWLNNKTIKNITEWIQNPDNNLIVAVDKLGVVIGVSLITFDGIILLNYVRPGYDGLGVGSEMLGEMELIAKRAGLSAITAESTKTAIEFYKKHGFCLCEDDQKASGGLKIFKKLSYP